MFSSHLFKTPLSAIVFAAALLYCAPGSNAFAQQQDQPLTNAAVIKLVRAGFKEKTVIVIIRNRAGRFELNPDRLIELKRNGVSENIILAMLAQNESTFLTDNSWSDDQFFRGTGRTGGNSPSTNGETDIFGSSSGSKGETRSRGERGGSEGERMTTGSATVRIIRPPSEAGGAALKLEKTVTLDNEAIINLVEAGFSEGTIIKRIENSPGEFDLAPAKVVELRKRRVTDAIITAMTFAMDGSEQKASTPGSNEEN